MSSPFVNQFFYFKFELVAYSEDFFKIVLTIKKSELAIAMIIVLANSPRYMYFLLKKIKNIAIARTIVLAICLFLKTNI